ncbi:MAG: chromosome segregation protein SMC [Deltaproteobacteria bacterium]
MKLKKLELFGFKSFYDKTSFDFSDGITAIVGPNGCGKSNIVDAVRWVLGEHAPSYLRSKALEDVIFAGSDAAGPLGMAEVALTFSNEDGIAPPGYESYAEIQVTRRTFRDGESEFFINKVPCRLKDIAELFLDTGAGARGYAIIEQGKIMTIVNARPDEKRLIIEEAAGVAKFRVRKKEAERKMESTRQNLARVRDILDEVRRQLGSIERQVRKAEKYKVLRDELRSLELLIAAARHHALSAERARAASELASIEGALAGARAEIARVEAARETETARLTEAEAALATLRSGHAALKEEIARRQAEWEGKGREERQLRDMVAETAAEIALLEEEILDLERRTREAEEGGRRRTAELSAARERLSALSAAAEETRTEHARVRSQADQAKSDLIVRVSLHSNARSGADSLQRMIDDSARAVARHEERIVEAGAAAGKSEAGHREAVAEEAAARDALARAEKAWGEADVRLAGVAARLEILAAERLKAEAGLGAATSRLSALSKVYEARDWTSSGVRAVLHHFAAPERAGGGRERGIYGVVGDLIETDPPYERAVEAILGERIQSVVVRDQSEGLSAIRFLKTSREGRGAFMPVALRTRGDAPAYLGEDGVIAPLTDVVRAPEECGETVRGLLGGTLLVRDLDCAVRLWNRNGVWNSYVTLDGDVVTADGTLVGGAQEQSESRILGIKREIRELEKAIAAASSEASRLASEEDDARRSRAALEARRAEMFSQREEASASLSRAEQKRAVVELAASQARGTVDALVGERDYLRGELERMTAELGVTETAARETEQARGEEEERVRALGGALEENRAAMEAAREALHGAEIEWAAMEEKDRSERALHRSLAEALGGKRSVVEDRGRRKAAYEEKAAALAGELASGRGDLEAAAAELARRQDEIDRRLGETAALSAALGAIDGTLREARRRETGAAARLSDLRLDAQRIEMDLAHLDAGVYQRHEVRPAELPVPDGLEEGVAAGREARAEEIRARMAGIGDVNLAAIEEHKELADRHAFLSGQKEDLEKSLDDLAKAIHRINRATRERFSEAFDNINAKFQEVFPKLFVGGRAHLKLLDEENLLESGVEIVASPPGKKLQSLNLLSGGEKALTAISLIFSIFLVKPSPFCLLDEADAPLDDANIDRFNSLVREMSSRYQFLLITHNKRTMELADAIYGVTMEKPGVSKVVSVRFQS